MFGRELRAPIDVVLGGSEETQYANRDEFVEAELLNQKEAYALARYHLGRRAERNKHSYDMRARSAKFGVGDWVWYYNLRRYVGRSPKWQRNYTGPFLVVGVLSAVNVVIQKSNWPLDLLYISTRLKLIWATHPRSGGLVMNRMPPVRA